MKLKKLIVPEYRFATIAGDFIFKNVEILIEPDSDITPETFKQDIDDYYISSKEIEKMEKYVDDKINSKNR